MRFISLIIVVLLPSWAWACDAGWSYGDPLQQEWPEADRATWYDTSQGSRLIPLDWYEALQLPDGRRFADRTTQETFALHFCEDTGRPVGVVVDEDPLKGPALGFNCAACHTGLLSDGTNRVVVEGAASMLDLQSYMAALFDGMLAVYRDSVPNAGPAWQGFATGVLGQTRRASDEAALQADVLAWLQRFNAIEQSVEAGGPWGHGRTDAVAVILNTASTLSDTRAGTVLPPASAPVSFPHVWNAPQMRRVQWNGSAVKLLDVGLLRSVEMGAIVRNVAEVLGVFAEIEVSSDAVDDWASYPNITSSVRMANLVRIERSMETLKSPAWPVALWGDPKADLAQWERGRALYDGTCAACHSVMDRDDLTVLIEDAAPGVATDGPVTRMVPAFGMDSPSGAGGIGTDPMMACNALTHTSWAGRFTELDDSFGAFRKIAKGAVLEAVDLEKFDREVITLRLIEELSLRMIFEKRQELVDLQQEDLQQEAVALAQGFSQALFGRPKGGDVIPQDTPHVPTPGTHTAATLDEARSLCASLLAGSGMRPEYKARPLNGIWATAPFLHNGSVPTLFDLLSPPDARPRAFQTGAVVFDPDKVGLGAALGQGPVSEFRSHDDSGQPIPGNFNGGHDMPASAACFVDPGSETCAADKAALLTYIKSL